MPQPKHKRFKRKQRLLHAKKWMENYTGKKLYHGYAKHYGTSKLCAVIELEILGVTFPPDLKENLKRCEIDRKNQKKAKKLKKVEETVIESDENFAYIVGYTPGGAPYGVTWEEMEQYSDDIQDSELEEDQLPF